MSTLHPPPTAPPPAGPRPPATPPPSLGDASRRALLLVTGLLLIGAGVAAALWSWNVAAVRVEVTTTPHPAVERVVLDLRTSGKVEVVAHELDGIVVEQRTLTTLWRPTVEQQVVGDELRLRSSRCGPVVNLGLARCSASFVVRVPASTTVVGELRHGEVTLAGLQGDASLSTGHGQLVARDVAGDLALSTGHGRVEVARATGRVAITTGHGEVSLTDLAQGGEVTTGHGRVEVAGVEGPLAVRTSHGTIDASGVGGETVTLTTGHGTIDLATVGAPSSVTLQTSHGDISVVLPADAPPYAITTNDSGRTTEVAVATDPGADHRLSAVTGHGSIRVHGAR